MENLNFFLLAAAVFVLFAAIDIATAILLKIKRDLFRNISLIVILALAVGSGIIGFRSFLESDKISKNELYSAYSYLQDGNSEKAAEHAMKSDSPHSEIVLLLSDCLRGSYASAFINSSDLMESGSLSKELHAQAEAVNLLARKMTGLEGASPSTAEAETEVKKIGYDSFALLKMSEENEVEFLSGYTRERMLDSGDFRQTDSETLSKMLLESPNDKELMKYSVKYYSLMGKADKASEIALELVEDDRSVENLALYTDVMAEKLANEGLSDDDKEIDTIVQEAEKAEKTAASLDEGNPRRDSNLEKSKELLEQAKGVKAKRIINWLKAKSPVLGDSTGIVNLQLSRLYVAAGDKEKAKKILVRLMERRENLSDESQIKTAINDLADVYYSSDASDSDMTAAIAELMSADAFLPDSGLSRGYSVFVRDFLKYERISIFVSSVNSKNYPTVRAYLNVNGIADGVESLANDFKPEDFLFTDNGYDVKDVKLIEDDAQSVVTIALVIDGSGSMGGSRIENAKKAVESCIANMDPETQEISIILYSFYGSILTPLTNDRTKLYAGAAQISAEGGTDISTGLIAGLESLENAQGSKAIILMTDGEDGSQEKMPASIEAAKNANVAVFTVSTGGGNREYMEDIATQTGGSYMEAVTDEELVRVYTALQSYIVNNYCFEYTVVTDTEANPRDLSVGLKQYEAYSYRTYVHSGLIMTKDGCYMVRGESGGLRLLYAEPSVVSKVDAALGVPIFISAKGAANGAQVFVNDKEYPAKAVENTAIAFTLTGNFKPGPLKVTVKLPSGSSRTTQSLLSISEEPAENTWLGQTIFLGDSNYIYADLIQRTNDTTFKLSGNVTLNDFLRTDKPVDLMGNGFSDSGRLSVKNGSIASTGSAYADFSEGEDNYGQMALGGSYLKALDVFNFTFDEKSIWSSYGSTMIKLPGFGEVQAGISFDGTEVRYQVMGNYKLAELDANLNFALNGKPLAASVDGEAFAAVLGYQLPEYREGGFYGLGTATGNDMIAVLKKDFLSLTGSGRVSGHIGMLEMNDANLAIDTSKPAFFEITGNAKYTLPISLGTGEATLTITSKRWLPDGVNYDTPGLLLDAKDLSKGFETQTPADLVGKAKVSYSFADWDGSFGWLLRLLTSDLALEGETVQFRSGQNSRDATIKAIGADESEWAMFTQSNLVIPIHDLDEISLFGTSMGGELGGTITVTQNQLNISLDVDGHIDNDYFGVKHDGKGSLQVLLNKSNRPDSNLRVLLDLGGETLEYQATASGNILPLNGFAQYQEE
ncbi:MAG: VWA domain-containing protein [Clostridiales bacterium]|nr:VWA domain-containing protein [Clostridiales bacterium]